MTEWLAWKMQAQSLQFIKYDDGWMNVCCLARVSLLPLTSAALEFTAWNDLCFILSVHIRFFLFSYHFFFHLYDSESVVSAWLLFQGILCHTWAAAQPKIPSNNESGTNEGCLELFITLLHWNHLEQRFSIWLQPEVWKTYFVFSYYTALLKLF